jgi:hypothetical protein
MLAMVESRVSLAGEPWEGREEHEVECASFFRQAQPESKLHLGLTFSHRPHLQAVCLAMPKQSRDLSVLLLLAESILVLAGVFQISDYIRRRIFSGDSNKPLLDVDANAGQKHLLQLSKIKDPDVLRRTVDELASSLDNKIGDVKEGIEGCIGNTPLIRIKSLSEATGCEILAKAEVNQTL